MPQFVGGRYQLIAQLGGGGMADVFLSKLSGKSDFAKLAVVKRLKQSEDEDPEIIAMFADEARLSARLNHPSIVQTFEVGEDEGGPFLVMEYIEGQPLGRIRSRAGRRSQPLPRAMALKILRETVGALAYSHTLIDHDGTLLKVVHRDVSPENIMVTYAGQTKLVDFGVAKTSASMSKTRAGVLKGKVAYMAPEQARSDENIDERVDIFAVGLIMWELLTAKRLWEGMSEAKVFERLLDKEPLPRTRSIDPEIPIELDEIVAKAIAKEKEDRYPTAHDLLDAIETVVSKLDLRASDRETGQFVSKLFETEREKVKALVSGSMAKKDDSGPTILPEDSSDPLLWRSSSSGMQSAPMLMSAKSDPSSSSGSKNSSVPAASTTSAGVVDTKITEAELGKPLNLAKVVLAVGGAAGVIAIAVLVGKGMGTTEAPIITTNPVVAPPSASAPDTNAPDVSIDVTVKPASAHVSMDGKPLPNPYHLKTPKGPAAHELHADADGYESRTMVLIFDRDRSVDLALNKGSVVYAPSTYARVLTTPGAPSASASPSASSTPSAAPSAAAPPAPSASVTPKGISEIDPKAKPSGKQDKLDTDVFKR